jgi:transposase
MAARSTDATAARRMLALALVLDGWTRTAAARAAGMDRQTLRDWVHRYNAEGPAGLSNRPHTGAPPRKLSPDQEAAVAAWVREGPDPGLGIVRWRCIDLRDAIDRRFGVRLHERSVGKLLARLNFSHVSVRPRHPEQDVGAQQAHKKTSPTWSPPCFPRTPAASRSSCGGRTRPGSASKAA